VLAMWRARREDTKVCTLASEEMSPPNAHTMEQFWGLDNLDQQSAETPTRVMSIKAVSRSRFDVLSICTYV